MATFDVSKAGRVRRQTTHTQYRTQELKTYLQQNSGLFPHDLILLILPLNTLEHTFWLIIKRREIPPQILISYKNVILDNKKECLFEK